MKDSAFGVVGALVTPQLAAIGAIAALLAHGTIVVEIAENLTHSGNIANFTKVCTDLPGCYGRRS